MFERMLKLAKRRNRGKKEPVLVGLVEYFHKQYQFLFSQYENLKRQEELLALDHLAALSKIQEIEIINKDLRKEADEKEKRLCDSETVHEGRITELEEQLIGLKNEVESLQFKKRDLEAQLDAKTAETKLQGETIKALYGQVSEVRDEATKFMKQESMVQIIGLKAEMDYLRPQKTSQHLIQVKTLKEELARKSGIEQVMAEEKEGLQMQVMELESEVDEEYKSKRINKTAQTMTLTAEVELMQQKVEFMMMEKSELELRTADQKRIMKERQENTNNSMESNSKLARRLSTGTTFNINVHYENKDIYKTIKEKLEQDNAALEEKPATCEVEMRKSRDSMEANKKAFTESNFKHENGHLKEKLATCEVELRKSRDSMEAGKNSWTESISRLEHENGELKEKLASCEAELRELRDSMNASKNAMNESNSKLMQENGELGEKLSCEGKLSEEEEKVKLLKAIADLLSRIGEMEKITKEKDEALLGREEEKRKAIRGLCLLIDYHRRCYDHLKEMVSGRTKKKT
ncbi:hypothetical protein ES288_A09G224400v1 [Gossypium darwinii]|uniref:NAB domain-containing protein n=1 Tax=Gossypium darwinii TaxID=34276 RepID=A0A5D2FBK7_GOSDA|nr:hypothetical protein ES288_A09G224400v1 [Gossypium darwinii]